MAYIAKDYWMICEQCGGQFRRSDMREHWTGAWLCIPYCWTERHPQDFVKVVEDKQTVPVARPDIVLQMESTTLAESVVIGDISFDLISATGLEDRSPISIQMDNGAWHSTLLNGDPSSNTITLLDSMPYKASSGNEVLLPSINNL